MISNSRHDIYNGGGKVKTTIDTTFDVRLDARGRDPDQTSPTLRSYHKVLWSKALPNGKPFLLDDTVRGAYLYHISDLGEFFLSSDSVIPSFRTWKRFAHIREQIPTKDLDYFQYIGSTIGGMMIFPGNRIDGKPTINGARGFLTGTIGDRFDLTLECIRRYYANNNSPLYDTFLRYKPFFALFADFRGYVDFFLLQDLVSADYSSVQFFTLFDNFISSPTPNNVASTASRKCVPG
jgi:hypothetical protein